MYNVHPLLKMKSYYADDTDLGTMSGIAYLLGMPIHLSYVDIALEMAAYK